LIGKWDAKESDLKQVLKGNHAVSQGVRLCRVQVISAYPITPQTTIVEEISELCARRELEANFIKVESEHSALAAVVGSSSAGIRSFTATSSHGLLLMHEVLHWTAGSRLPIVMTNVNRAVGPGWNIWADQTDSISQRDTGWIQIYCESNQEVLDSVIMAYKLAESVYLPVMITYDAFFLSHTSEIVDVPDIDQVDDFLPPYMPKYELDINDPRMFGGMIGPDAYMEERYLMYRASREALDHYPRICDEFGDVFERNYEMAECFFCDDAETIIVTAGTITSVSRLVVEKMRAQGLPVGLMKIRLFRPVPERSWRDILGTAEKIIVIDRNLSPCMGGVFASEVQSVLSPLPNRSAIYPVVAGLGGRDVTPADVEGIVTHAMNTDHPPKEPIFWGLKE
jgi:pyruvate/2-oxoacid:ferredoxin oxidoreductase alpha subunit